MLAALAIGTVFAAVRRPTVQRAARAADRQLHTASRLATAAEVLDGQLGGALAAAQLDDAWRMASGIRPWHAYPRGWRRVQFELAALAASAAVLVLSLAGVVSPLDVPWLGRSTQLDSQAADAEAAQAAAATAAADALAQQADLSANPAAAAQTLDDLQSAAAQSQAAQAALQKLGEALRTTSAARDVGEALRAGNFDAASTRLDALGKESDQLSRLSKRELANAMQRAAFDSVKLDPPLAVAEDRAARALNRGVYTETKAALEDLSKAIGDAKQGIVSQEALAQQLDKLQQQQQQAAPGGGAGDSAEYIPDIPGQQPNQVGLVQGLSSTIQVPGPEGDPKNAAHSGVGQEAGGDPLGDIASRLNIPPVDLSVDTQLANDQGHTKPNPQAPTVKISDTNQNGVRPSDVVQPGDPVQDVAEQTIEPIAQRGAVRTFFKSTGDPNTTAP
jgi:hypothetical protein